MRNEDTTAAEPATKQDIDAMFLLIGFVFMLSVFLFAATAGNSIKRIERMQPCQQQTK